MSLVKDEFGQDAIGLQKQAGDTPEDLRAYAAGAADRLIKGLAPREAATGLTRSELQIRAIEDAITSSGYAPLSIPEKGKALLRNDCMKSQPRLFGSAGQFDEAWKAARKQGRVRMEYHEKYIGR
jgi:hypothetical protein